MGSCFLHIHVNKGGHLLSLVTAALTGVRWQLFMVLFALLGQWCWAAFHVPLGHLDIFFGKMSVQILCLFLIRLFGFLLLSCKNSLYPEYWPLSDMWFANIFSHSEGCLFVLTVVSFTVHLRVFALVSLVWGDMSKKMMLRLMPELTVRIFF